MRNKRATIAGQVKRQQDDSGIHGLAVQLVDVTDKLWRVHSEVLTASDGSFSMQIDAAQSKSLFSTKGRMRLDIRDRDGDLIHRTKENIRVRGTGAATTFVKLPPAALARHDRSRLSVGSVSTVLRPSMALGRVRMAIRQVSAPDSMQREHFEHTLPCIEPEIGGFHDVLVDARGTIDGDPRARRRLLDTINVIDRNVRRRVDASSLSDEPVGGRSVADKLSVNGPTTRIRLDRLNHQPSETAARDKALMLVIALTELADGDQTLAYRYANLALAQLGAYQRLSPLDSAASSLLGRPTPGNARHFADMLGFFGRDCDPLGRIPDPNADIDQWEPGFIECAFHGIDQIVEPGIEYFIESVTPNDACAGDLITITGQGFGFLTSLTQFINQVRFTRRSLDDSDSSYVAATDVIEWTDSAITVRVPDSAVAGPLWLRIRERTVRICDQFHDIYRRGNEFAFAGGSGPDIIQFSVNGTTNLVVEPGVPVELSWQVVGAESVTIHRISAQGPGIDGTTTRESQGSIDLGPFLENTKTFTTYELRATNACGTNTALVSVNLDWLPDISIVGIEVVQVIQRYDFALDIQDPANNAIRLAAHKRTMVRVYVDSGIRNGFNRGDGPNQQTVRGSVRFKSDTTDDFQSAAGPLVFDSANARPVDELRRGEFTHSLNFELTPFTDLSGMVEIEATAWVGLNDPGTSADAGVRDVASTTLEFHPMRDVAIVRIRVADGPNGLPSPTTAQYAAGIAGMIRRLPIADDGLTITEAPGFTTPTTMQDLNVRDGWVGLLNEIEAAADGLGNNGEIWGAMVGQTGSHAVSGLARRPWSALVIDEKPKFVIQAGFPGAFAHEAIHTFWIGHPDCPGSTNPDGSPCVATPDTRLPRSTETVGMDVAGRTVMPLGTPENMDQVCCGANDGTNTWTSIAAWDLLFDALRA